MKRCIILLLAVLSMLQYKLSAQDSFIYKMQGEKLYLQEDSIYVVINFKSLEYTIDSIEIATTEATKSTFQLS